MRLTARNQENFRRLIRSETRKATYAKVASVDGNLVNLRIGNSPTLIRGVEVAGDASLLKSGEEVSIIWKKGRPVVMGSSAVLYEETQDRTVLPGMFAPDKATLWFGDFDFPTGTLDINLNTSQIYNARWRQTTAANGDEFLSQVYLSKGYYNLTLIGSKATGCGKTDLYLDDVLVLSGSDWYAAANTFNVVFSANLSIDEGWHTVRIVVNGKNASSTGYVVFLTGVFINRNTV